MTTSRLDKVTQIAFKWKALEQGTRPDGSPSYKVQAFAPYGQGFDKYPTGMFLHAGDEAETGILVDRLRKLTEGVVVTFDVKASKVKEGKKDDGAFRSYFWNVMGYPDAVTTATPGSPPLTENPTVPGTPFSFWEDRQQTIEVSWAINQAREVIQHFYGNKNGLPVDGYKDFLSHVERLTPDILAMKGRIMAYLQAPAHAQDSLEKSTPSPSEAPDVAVDKDGPSGAAADFEALVNGLPKASSPKDLAGVAKTLGYKTPESIRAVIGPAAGILNYAEAVAKLVENSPLKPRES